LLTHRQTVWQKHNLLGGGRCQERGNVPFAVGPRPDRKQKSEQSVMQTSLLK